LGPRLRAMRERAMAKTALARGLEWRGEVGMTELSGWEYGTRTKEIADVLATDDLKGLGGLAVAGGMLPAGTDLAALAVSFTAATAGATYSPLDKQVLLVSEGPRGAFKDEPLLTHELVHALQDQHFDLLRLLLARPYNFDRAEALFALVEGDAMSVERRLQFGEAWARLTPEQMARREEERFAPYRRGVGALFPPLLTETFVFRYRDGLRFVEAMRRASPPVSADDIFRRPPASSEQVLHPEKYAANEAPREVSVNVEGFAREGWRLTAATPIGEIGVRGALLAGVPVGEAVRASAGWGGDCSFLFEREGRAPLFVWKTAWDKAADAKEFYRSFNALQGRRAAPEVIAFAPDGAEQQAWRDGGVLTYVRLEGEAVLVLRGSAEDVADALRLALAR
ncbi:MAG: hypothetical protein M3416_20655, partial [Acidobacteriota bacterium]|nr:hypothetical protein [Acidobacteriota bacterium]